MSSCVLYLVMMMTALQKTGEYESILKEHAGQSSIAVNQIELDLLRTLPTNKYYEKPDAQGVSKPLATPLEMATLLERYP